VRGRRAKRSSRRKTVFVQHLDDLKNRLWLVTARHNLEHIARLEKLLASPR
jgi:hypothetical protein